MPWTDKAWEDRLASTSGGTEPVDPAGITGTVPTGTVLPFAGTAAPTGFLLCDGASQLRATYLTLFGIIGTAFGAADGTHFNVPDMARKFPMGKNAGDAIGATGGSYAHSHTTPDHAALAHSAHAGSAVANHVVTQPGAHSAHVVTQPGAHSNHVVTQPSDHANNIAHTHVLQAQGGTTAAVTGTHLMTSTATGGSARGIAAGDNVGSSGSGAALAHSGAAVDAHSAHSGAAVDGHSAHSGAAVDAHGVTQPSAHTDHPTVAHGSGGTANPPFVVLNYIIKT